VNAYFAAHALLPDGWARNVRFAIDASGNFTSVEPDSTPGGAMPLPGFVVPGMPNAHSHAFQRSLAGRTERAGGSGDSFWTWREAMYAAVEGIEPDAFEAVAADTYVTMLEAGYTHVCEFHYVHRAPNGAAYARATELSDRIVAAARTAGIGLTLLPVLYRYADFGAVPPAPRQARFVLTFDEYATLWQTLHAAYAGDPQITLGAAPHSLRAVGLDDLRKLERLVRTATPLHVHVSEQEREVEACRAAFGTTPVALLADTVTLDERWCLVHATHATHGELATIAAAGAVVGLCPTTEANLGDGIFAASAFTALGGRFAIGSDSNVTIDVAEELRWLEYSQRLTLRRRNVLQDAPTPSVGRYLYAAALRGGAQAAGRRIGALALGYRADAVALELPQDAKAAGDELVDAAIFRSGSWRVREVVAGGQVVVRDGRHLARAHDRPNKGADRPNGEDFS
jgi:formimidoylglutamate deiminase